MQLLKTTFSLLAVFRDFQFFIMFCLFFGLKGHTQNIIFNHLGIDLGLSNSVVFAIAQDEKGYMWFATQNGLNRYDSKKFEAFYKIPGDSSGLSDSYITALLFDSKRRLWVGTANGLNLYNPSDESFNQIRKHKGKGSICDEAIMTIYEDRKGRIWVGTRKGLALLVSDSFVFENYLYEVSSAAPGIRDVRAVFEDSEGAYWLGTTTGLLRMNFRNGLPVYESFESPSAPIRGMKKEFVATIIGDSCNTVWIGTNGGGLYSWDRKTDYFVHYPISGENGTCNDKIRQLLLTRDGSLWVGTMEGISVRNPATGRFTHYQHKSSIQSLSNNSVYAIFQDKVGSVWIGTYNGGINLIYKSQSLFQRIELNGLNNNVVSAVTEDNRGRLWVGTQGAGIAVFDKKRDDLPVIRLVRRYATPLIGSDYVTCLYKAPDGRIWVGTHMAGVSCIDPENGKIMQYRYSEQDINTLNSDDIEVITGDDSGRIWVGTNNDGICLFNPADNSFVRAGKDVKGLRSGAATIRSILYDSKGNLLVGSHGLEVIGASGNVSKPDQLSSILIRTIFEDSKKRIWLGGAYNGLREYRISDGVYRAYHREDGLSSDHILGILEDKKGTLWITTDNGITSLNPDLNVIRNYSIPDGLPTNEFKPNAVLRSEDGLFFMGTTQGLVYFDPEKVVVNDFPPRIVFTDLKLFNKRVLPGDESGILSKPLEEITDITFRHFQDIFTIDFAGLSYIMPEKNKFAYMLEGLESRWNYVSTPSATYTNLNSGTYTLRIKSANNDGIWSAPRSLKIHVLKPWWKTWWAYLFYLVLVGVIIFYISRFFWMQKVLQYEQALYQAKLDFFSNVTHEIRTHITLIQGPIDVVLGQEHINPRTPLLLSSAKKNGERLFRLVSELLEFRKAEVNQAFLNIAEHDLVAFSKEILQSFSQLAESRKIETELFTTETEMRVPFDPGQLEKVIFNLLINAFKFTDEGGRVILSLNSNPKETIVEVSDTGRGIPQEHLRNIFSNFFQVNEIGKSGSGYGIGLALSKKIVEQHRGTISVRSAPATGGKPGYTVFTVRLPKV